MVGRAEGEARHGWLAVREGFVLNPYKTYNLLIINMLIAERVGFGPCEIAPVNNLAGFRTAEYAENARNPPSWNDPGTVNPVPDDFRSRPAGS